jgi:apolipoprotein N-acyltransferase
LDSTSSNEPSNPTPDGDSSEAKPPSPLTGRGRQPLPPKVAHGLAVLSGTLYFAAFPGIDVWPLAFVALIPLALALEGQPARRAAAIGWTAGFTMTMTGFYWLLEMLETFSGFPTAISFVFMAILCAYQAGRIALMGWLVGRAQQRGWSFHLAFALAFIASELIFPLLFPWYFGATVHQIPALTQVAEIGSPIAVGLVLVAANLALAEPFRVRLHGASPNLRRTAALALVPVVAALYGFVRIGQVDAQVATAEPLQAGIVQANMSLMGKREDPGEGLRRHLRLSRELEEGGPLDLMVWSETSVTGAVRESEVEEIYPRRFTRLLRTPTIFGAVLVRPVDDPRSYVLFNSALITDEGGAIRGRYDKTFLLAFGEYLPLADTFPILHEWSPNSGRFTPGSSIRTLPLGDKAVNVHICYEDVVPAFVNAMMRADPAQLLVNITNDAWFGDSTEPWIHLALAKFRAIEHRRFLIRSTNSGVSAFVDPVGRVVAHTGTYTEEAIRAKLAWMDGRTPYQITGDGPWWLATAMAGLFAFVRRDRLLQRPAAKA